MLVYSHRNGYHVAGDNTPIHWNT